MPKIKTTKIQLSTLIGAVLFCNIIFSQEYKASKIIVDQGTKAPLGFVNINNSLDNTISNEDGQFVFISKENSIKISRVGYKPVATTFAAIAVLDTIFLEAVTTELEEVVVTNTSSLLNDVYRNVAKWYPIGTFSEKFFIRAVLKKNNEITRLQDISGRIESNAMFLNQTIKKKEHRLEILNLRKTDIVNKAQVEYYAFLSANSLYFWFSGIFTVPSDYVFNKVKFTDPQYIKIEYSKSDQNVNSLYRNGYYLIDKDEKSIKEVGYKLYGDKSQIPYQSKGPIKWRTTEADLVVNYVKSPKNNKYYVGSAKLSSTTEVVNEKKGEKDIYECTYDLITVDSFIEENVKSNFSVSRDLFKSNFSYSEEFWNSQNQLPLTKELKSFLQRINDKKSNKSDFKIQGNF